MIVHLYFVNTEGERNREQTISDHTLVWEGPRWQSGNTLASHL